MRRRTALTTAGSALAIALGGCLTDSDSTDTGTSDGTDEDDADDEPGDGENDGDDVPGDEWNDEYLGEQMATTPSLEFSTIPDAQLAGVVLEGDDGSDGVEEDPRVDEPPHEITVPDGADTPTDPDGEFRVRLLETGDERDDVLDMQDVDEETRDGLDAVDFDESVLVVVESGYGSSSIVHRWARAENVDDGVHLHGYYEIPYERLSDMGTRLSVLEVERPEDGESLARVSLTVSPDHRVHFNSTEGIVSVGD